MAKDGIEPGADLVVSNACWNPRPLERDVVFCRPGKLVFAENIYPGRHANVNHAASPVKADGIFMSVDIPAGTDTDKQSRN